MTTKEHNIHIHPCDKYNNSLEIGPFKKLLCNIIRPLGAAILLSVPTQNDLYRLVPYNSLIHTKWPIQNPMGTCTAILSGHVILYTLKQVFFFKLYYFLCTVLIYVGEFLNCMNDELPSHKNYFSLFYVYFFTYLFYVIFWAIDLPGMSSQQ